MITREILKEQIKNNGENVFHEGMFEGPSHLYNKVGFTEGDTYYVYIEGKWYHVSDSSLIIKVNFEEEDPYEKYECKDVFSFEEACLYELEEFCVGHCAEVVDFFKSTKSQR